MHECNQAISGWKEYHMSENTISLYVYEGGQGEITEKKSRFIATVRPVESEDEAVSFINETKKKYWDARHNCSAFVIGKRQELTRCSDDGSLQAPQAVLCLMCSLRKISTMPLL